MLVHRVLVYIYIYIYIYNLTDNICITLSVFDFPHNLYILCTKGRPDMTLDVART